MPVADINYLAGLVAGLLSMVIGFVWYGPLFANAWVKESKLSKKDIGNGPGPGCAFVTVTSLIQAYVLALFVDFTNATAWMDGAVTVTWIWIGFVATSYTATYVFSKKSLN